MSHKTITRGLLREIVRKSVLRLLRESARCRLVENVDADGAVDLVQDSSCDGDYQHYKVMIPADKKQTLDSFLRKSKKMLPDLEWKWSSQSRKEVFTHVAVCYGSDAPGGVERRNSWDEEHTLYDLEVTYPISCNGWQLIATIDHGDVTVTDVKHQLQLSNPEHGVNYKKCDACGRPTEAMFYIVRNKNTGEEMQVGSACAKKFGLGLMKLIYQFERELYKCFVYYAREDYDDDGDSAGGDRIKWGKAIPVAVAFNGAMENYLRHPEYVKGAGGTVEMIEQAIRYGEVDDNPGLLAKMRELFAKYTSKDYDWYKSHVQSDDQRARMNAAELYEDSFDCKIWSAVLDDAYITVRDLWKAFYAVKKFKQLEEVDARDVSKDLSVGDVIKINGVITKTSEAVDPYYGRVTPIYWITTDDGYHLKRTGVVPFDSSTNRVDNVYAAIKWKSDNGEIYVLDRVTKHPKKGAKVVNLGEGRLRAALGDIIMEQVRRVLSEKNSIRMPMSSN